MTTIRSTTRAGRARRGRARRTEFCQPCHRQWSQQNKIGLGTCKLLERCPWRRVRLHLSLWVFVETISQTTPSTPEDDERDGEMTVIKWKKGIRIAKDKPRHRRRWHESVWTPERWKRNREESNGVPRCRKELHRVICSTSLLLLLLLCRCSSSFLAQARICSLN